MNRSLYTKDMPMVNAQKMRESKERLRERASDYVDELNEKNAAIASEIVSASTSNNYVEVLVPITTGRVICFDLETTGFTGDDGYVSVGRLYWTFYGNSVADDL
jgi:hypothetical protein